MSEKEHCSNCGHGHICRMTRQSIFPERDICLYTSSQWISDRPEEEFFVVAARRRDGGIPALTKGMGETMYHTVEDARRRVAELGKWELPGVGIGVFRVLARVVGEVKP